jgi:hypothetical protein
VVDTLRFFGQLRWGAGNYTEERRQLFAELTLDEYRTALEEMKGVSKTVILPAILADHVGNITP